MGSGRAAAVRIRAVPPAREPVKPTALMAGIGDEGLADAGPGAVDQREDTGVQAEVLDGLGDGLADEFGGAGVGVVGLDDHGAAGGERRGGVSARHGESQREVAGAEDGHRAQRDLALPDVGAGQRCAVRQGRIDADAAEVALADHVGKQPQLAGGAGAFALQPGGGQAGLLAGARSISSSPMASMLSAMASRKRACCLGVEGAEGVIGLRGRGGGRLELLLADQRVGRFQLFVGGRVEAEGGPAVRRRRAPRRSGNVR